MKENKTKKGTVNKWRKAVTGNTKKQMRETSSYGYLKLPKGISVFKEEPGKKASFDILPYIVSDNKHPDRENENGIAVPGTRWYKRPFWIIRNVGEAKETLVSPMTLGKKCPAVEYRKQRIAAGASKQETDALKLSKRNLYIIIPKDMKGTAEEMHIWNISQAMFQNKLNEEIEDKPDCAVFPSPEEGMTLKVRFASKVIADSKPFAETSRIDFAERDEQYTEKDLKDVPDLDKMLVILSYDEIKKKLLEIEEPDDEDNESDDDDKPAIRKDKRKKEEEEEEPEEEEEEEPEEEEPEEEEPEEEDEEDDDDDVEEDEDEEKERLKRNKRKEKPKSGKKKTKCPKGHKFGVDTDEFKDCKKCPVWDACYEKQSEDDDIPY
jgi:hypothetical protein